MILVICQMYWHIYYCVHTAAAHSFLVNLLVFYSVVVTAYRPIFMLELYVTYISLNISSSIYPVLFSYDKTVLLPLKHYTYA